MRPAAEPGPARGAFWLRLDQAPGRPYVCSSTAEEPSPGYSPPGPVPASGPETHSPGSHPGPSRKSPGPALGQTDRTQREQKTSRDECPACQRYAYMTRISFYECMSHLRVPDIVHYDVHQQLIWDCFPCPQHLVYGSPALRPR